MRLLFFKTIIIVCTHVLFQINISWRLNKYVDGRENESPTAVRCNKYGSALSLVYRQPTSSSAPQWGAVDAEIKVPSDENIELKGSPFRAWSRSVYSHSCYVYCQGFLSCLFLPIRTIHQHFFSKPLHTACASNTRSTCIACADVLLRSWWS